MLFKVLPKDAFESLMRGLIATDEVIAPKRVGVNAKGKPLHHFLPIQDFKEMELDYESSEFSAKSYFLPFQETLSTFRFKEGGDWAQEIQYEDRPRAIVGLHACDIHALIKLDKVFTKEFFPSPYYLSRRRNTLVVGVDHAPCEGGFCRSLGTDTVSHGFDLFLTDLGDRYFVAVGSDHGFSLIQGHGARAVTEADTRDYLAARRKIAAGFKTTVQAQNLPNLLDIRFESKVWERWGEKCLSCGSCAMVCPTCYCYGVAEDVSMDFREATKVKRLYSCNLVDFALVAGGHNFRPDPARRLKYRYYHQYRGFVETYGEPKCVGCNRCGRTCLAGINPPEVIGDLQAEERP